MQTGSIKYNWENSIIENQEKGCTLIVWYVDKEGLQGRGGGCQILKGKKRLS